MPILLVIQKTIVIYHKVSLYILFTTCNSYVGQNLKPYKKLLCNVCCLARFFVLYMNSQRFEKSLLKKLKVIHSFFSIPTYSQWTIDINLTKKICLTCSLYTTFSWSKMYITTAAIIYFLEYIKRNNDLIF